MLELSQDQKTALRDAGSEPVRITDADSHREFVLLDAAVYDRLQEIYDDSPWTEEEMELLAWEAGKSIGWEEMDEYDSLSEKP